MARVSDRSRAGLRCLGSWEEEERRRLKVILNAMAPHMRPQYRERLQGAWVATLSHQPDGTRYYVLHRVGLGMVITGASVNELIGGLIASGIYDPPFSAGPENE